MQVCGFLCRFALHIVNSTLPFDLEKRLVISLIHLRLALRQKHGTSKPYTLLNMYILWFSDLFMNRKCHRLSMSNIHTIT